MSVAEPTPERIIQVATGGWAAGILGTAVSHGLFTHLAAGEDTAEKLATRAGVSPRGGQALLDGLLGLGLVDLDDGAYRNGPEAAAFLVEDQPGFLGGLATVMLAGLADWSALPEAARTDNPVTAESRDPVDHPFWAELVAAIAPLSAPVAMVAADILHLSDAGPLAILDVGGGSGVYSAIWLNLNPAAHATQLDWASVNAIARQLTARRGVADRFACIDGDLHTADFGSDQYDIGVYSHMARQEGPDDNRAVFAKFRQALKPGGTLVMSDFVVDDDRSGPPFSLIFAAQMVLGTKEGRTWRRADYQIWLARAGFDNVTFQPTPTPATLIFARWPAYQGPSHRRRRAAESNLAGQLGHGTMKAPSKRPAPHRTLHLPWLDAMGLQQPDPTQNGRAGVVLGQGRERRANAHNKM